MEHPDCEPLRAAPECLGCRLEAEVVEYYRCKGCKTRVGYRCTCGTIVVRNFIQGMGILF